MRICSRLALILLLAWMLVPAASAQQAPDDLKDGFLGRFNYAAQRLVRLADALPAETFSWSPGEGVMTVEHVFMHIIHYNYYYPASSLGIAAPDGIDMEGLEALTGKAAVLEHLEASLDHVRAVLDAMTETDLSQSVRLYGRNTEAWNVMFQLQMHLGEHLGQLIAYTRMNGIVPPWSRS